MPAKLATTVCILFIFYLFWVDLKSSENSSKALWIPFIWMFLAGSRFASAWMNLGTPNALDVYMEGSPIDRAVFFFLIIASVVILLQRRLDWNYIFKNNLWIWLFFFFGLLSISWSDFPFVSFKRWIKGLGTVSMALVILTEVNPYESFRTLLKRLAFLMMPLSVLFIMYYPNLGRAYHIGGQPMFTGIATQKNSLGALCLIFGIYFCWNLLYNRREGIELGDRLHSFIDLILLTMIAWLLYMSHSATSLGCMCVAICLLLTSRLPAMARAPNRFIQTVITSIVLFVILELFFDITEIMIAMLGRAPDLTSRVPIWKELLSMVKNPIVGFGFEIFWAGERMKDIWAFSGSNIITAHNGYIDLYLNLGIIGLSLLLISIIAGTINAFKHLHHEYAYAVLRITLITVVLIYNWTEASFKPLSNLFLLLLVGVLAMPDAKNDQKQQ